MITGRLRWGGGRRGAPRGRLVGALVEQRAGRPAGLGRLVGDPVAGGRVGDTLAQRRALTSLLPYSDQQPRSGKPFAIEVSEDK